MMPVTRNGDGTIHVRPGAFAVVASLLIGAVGFVYGAGSVITEINGKLDRNCRIEITNQANLRFLIVEHAEALEVQKTGHQQKSELADSLRSIFQQSGTETC